MDANNVPPHREEDGANNGSGSIRSSSSSSSSSTGSSLSLSHSSSSGSANPYLCGNMDIDDNAFMDGHLSLLPFSRSQIRGIRIRETRRVYQYRSRPYVLDLELHDDRNVSTGLISYALLHPIHTIIGISVGTRFAPYNDNAFQDLPNRTDAVSPSLVQAFKQYLHNFVSVATQLKEQGKLARQLDMVLVSAFGTASLLEDIIGLLEVGGTTILKLTFVRDDTDALPTKAGLSALGHYLRTPFCTLTNLALTGLTPVCYNQTINELSSITGESATLSVFTLAEPVGRYYHDVLEEPITEALRVFLSVNHLGANLEHLMFYGVLFQSSFVQNTILAVKEHKTGDLRLSIGGHYSVGVIVENPLSEYVRVVQSDFVRVLPETFHFHTLKSLELPYDTFCLGEPGAGQLTPAQVISKAHRLSQLWLSEIKGLAKSLYKGRLARGDEETDCETPFRALLENEEVEVWFRFFITDKSPLFGTL